VNVKTPAQSETDRITSVTPRGMNEPNRDQVHFEFEVERISRDFFVTASR
jgi:hypothetical protein